MVQLNFLFFLFYISITNIDSMRRFQTKGTAWWGSLFVWENKTNLRKWPQKIKKNNIWFHTKPDMTWIEWKRREEINLTYHFEIWYVCSFLLRLSLLPYYPLSYTILTALKASIPIFLSFSLLSPPFFLPSSLHFSSLLSLSLSSSLIYLLFSHFSPFS